MWGVWRCLCVYERCVQSVCPCVASVSLGDSACRLGSVRLSWWAVSGQDVGTCVHMLGEGLGPGSSGSPRAPGPPRACPVDPSTSHAGLAAHLAVGCPGARALPAGASWVWPVSRRPHGPAFQGIPCALPPPRGHLWLGLPLGPPPRATAGRGCLGRKTGRPACGRVRQAPGCQGSPARRSPGRCLGSSRAQGHEHWAEPWWSRGPQISDPGAGGGFAVFPGPKPPTLAVCRCCFSGWAQWHRSEAAQTRRKEQEVTRRPLTCREWH